MTYNENAQDRFAINKYAFEDVMGDPFAFPEAIDGHYHTLSNRSEIQAARNSFDEGKATPNPARPSALDFLCDVEKTLSRVILDKNLLIKFERTYIHGFTDATGLNAAERTYWEQRLGHVFLLRGIAPVARYFKTIRY